MKKLWVLMLLPLGLVGCASDKDPKPTRLCPQVAIVRELERVTTADGAIEGKAGVIGGAGMLAVEGGCAYGDEGGVDVTFTVKLKAERGPRMAGDKIGFPFFVALVGPDNAVVQKKLMTAAFSFGSGERFATRDEPLHIYVPVGKNDTAEFYRVLLGFQLTEEQLNAVRAKENAWHP
jgi:hypothetical protein